MQTVLEQALIADQRTVFWESFEGVREAGR